MIKEERKIKKMKFQNFIDFAYRLKNEILLKTAKNFKKIQKRDFASQTIPY